MSPSPRSDPNTDLFVTETIPSRPAHFRELDVPEHFAVQRANLEGAQHVISNLASTGKVTVGWESERAVVDSENGFPEINGGIDLLTLVEASAPELRKVLKEEVGNHVVELALPPHSLVGSDNETDIVEAARCFSAAMKDLTNFAFPEHRVVASTDSFRCKHVNRRFLNPNERYSYMGGAVEALNQQWPPNFTRTIQGYHGDTTISLSRMKNRSFRQLSVDCGSYHFELNDISFLLNMWPMGEHLHVGIADQRDYLIFHRLWDAVGPFLVALTASSPLCTFTEDSFTWLKSARMGFMLTAANHPTRVGYPALDWPSSKPGWVDSIKKLIRWTSDWPLFPAELAKQGYENAFDIETVQILAANSRTSWPYTRLTVEQHLNTNEDGNPQYSLRPEIRVIDSCPTDADMMASFLFGIGLVYGLKDQFEKLQIPIGGPSKELDKFLNFQDIVTNMDLAAIDGLQATLAWIDEKGTTFKCPAYDLIRTHLLPIARAGLESLGVDRQSVIDPYMAIIYRRVAFQTHKLGPGFEGLQGLTPADMKIFLEQKMRLEFSDVQTRLGKMVLELADMDEAARDQEIGQGDFVQWFVHEKLGGQLEDFIPPEQPLGGG